MQFRVDPWCFFLKKPGKPGLSNPNRTVVVAGATGRQGRAVAKQLLVRGWSVRALTRDPSKAAAQALSEKGAQVVQADLDDPGSIRSAVHGAHGLFRVQNFWEHGYDSEVRQSGWGDVGAEGLAIQKTFAEVCTLGRISGDRSLYAVKKAKDQSSWQKAFSPAQSLSDTDKR